MVGRMGIDASYLIQTFDTNLQFCLSPPIGTMISKIMVPGKIT
jgi:hypothetical protein